MPRIPARPAGAAPRALVTEAPEATSGWGYEQVQPVAIGQLVGLERRFYDFDTGICKCRHMTGTSDGYATLESGRVPRNVPDLSMAVKEQYRTMLEEKCLFLPCFLEFCGRSWTSSEELLVPEIGIEPTTYALRMRRSTN